MLQGVLQDGTLYGPPCKILGRRLAVERRLPSGLSTTLQAFPPHAGPPFATKYFPPAGRTPLGEADTGRRAQIPRASVVGVETPLCPQHGVDLHRWRARR